MAINPDQMAASQTLRRSRERCLNTPVDTCVIKNTIDFTLKAKSSLTYRYILATALTAKATDARIDILSLQASDELIHQCVTFYVFLIFQYLSLWKSVFSSN